MSIVGPRPLLIEYLPYYTEEERHRHDVRPGLTGLAQVNGRNNLLWEERFKIDIEYVNTVSFCNDIKIIILTIKKVLFKEDIEMGNLLKFKRLDIERKKKKQIVRLNKELFMLQKDNIYECIMDLLKQDNDQSKRIIKNMERFIKDGSAIIYAIMIDCNIVGFIWGYFIQEQIIHINYFVVLDEYRGKQNGYNLLNTMININKNHIFELLVDVDNQRAIKFYEKYGFKQIKTINGKIKMKFGGEIN